MNYKKIGLWTTDRVPVLKRHPWVFWTGCFAAAAIVTVILCAGQHEEEQPRFLKLCAALGLAGLLLVPGAFYLCSRAFLEWARSVESFVHIAKRGELIEWYNTELAFFAGSRAMLVLALVFAAVAAFGYAEGGFSQCLTLAGWIWVECLVFLSAFMAGCGLWAMCRGGIAIWRLGARFEDSVVVREGRFGVLSTGRMLAYCWAIIGAVWFLYTLSALFGPEQGELRQVLYSAPVLLLAWPTLPLICGTFTVSQIPLHRAMIAYKRREILRVEQRLDAIMPDAIENLAKEKREEIEFLRRRWSELDHLPEWPFGARSLASVGGSSLLAVLPVVVKLVELAKPLGGWLKAVPT